MSESEHDRYNDKALSLGDIVLVLTGETRKILLTTFLAGLIAAIVSVVFLDNIYRSTAAVVVNATETPTDEVTDSLLSMQPPQLLNIETVGVLAGSTDIKTQLYDLLKKNKQLEKNITFKDFLKQLTVRTEQEFGRDRKLLPVLYLSADTKNSENSRVIADKWAQIVTTNSRELYFASVEDLDLYIQSMSSKNSDELIKRESAYSKVLLDSALDVNKTELEQNMSSYAGFFEEIQTLNNETQSMKAVLDSLTLRLTQDEYNGSWIGDKYLLDKNILSTDASEITTSTRGLFRTIKHLVSNQKELVRINKESGLESNRLLLESKSMQLQYAIMARSKSSNALARTKTEYENLTEAMKEISATIDLNKAITDEALWQTHLKQGTGDSKISDTLVTQIENPVYYELQKKSVLLGAEVDGLTNQSIYHKEKITEIKKEIKTLTDKISKSTVESDRLKVAIEKGQEVLEFLHEEYNENKKKKSQLSYEYLQSEAQLLAKKEALEEIKTGINKLSRIVLEAQDELEVHQRSVDSLTAVQTSLSQKAEEVALLKISTEKSSRSGVSVLFNARENPTKIKPYRSRICLMVMFFAFLSHCCVALVGKFMKVQ